MTSILEKVAQGPGTKSDKIRKLHEAGFSKSEIARALGIRYQFARNVIVDDERMKKNKSTEIDQLEISQLPSSDDLNLPIKIVLGHANEIQLPPAWVSDLGLQEGSALVAVFDGVEIRICTLDESIRRARELVQKIVPAGVSLSDSIIDDRRTTSELEINDNNTTKP